MKKNKKARKRENKTKHLLAAGSLVAFLSLMIVGMRLFYPYHIVLGAALIIAAFSFWGKAMLRYERKIRSRNFYVVAADFVMGNKRYFLIIVCLVAVSGIILVLFPQGKDPFRTLSQAELEKSVRDDLEISLVLMDKLEISANSLIGSELLDKDGLTADDREKLRELWVDFLLADREAEELIDVHKYFHKINFLRFPQENSESFIIGYSLYIKRYELLHRLIENAGSHAAARKLLNEDISALGKENVFDKISADLYDPKTAIRIQTGSTYLAILNVKGEDIEYPESYQILKDKAKKSYDYLFENIDEVAAGSVMVSQSVLENNMLNIWFPLQKNTAFVMGETYVSRRHKKLIGLGQIEEMRKRMEPGDIIVERRNWYMSNIGIPGFWPHAALYTGSLDELDAYFGELFPNDGYSSFGAMLEKEFPEVREKLQSKDENGHEYSVIEGKSPGIILSSLEESTMADYVGILRPRVSKEDKMRALLRSFENYQKPYDYDFDFETRDKLVCSELVYDAYLPTREKKGLDFQLSEMLGRKIMSPTDIVKKFYDEHDQDGRQLDFVYFIDGNEKLKKAIVKGEEEFMTTWTRQKYDIAQE